MILKLVIFITKEKVTPSTDSNTSERLFSPVYNHMKIENPRLDETFNTLATAKDYCPQCITKCRISTKLATMVAPGRLHWYMFNSYKVYHH